jgi:predicted transcriptional regulator
LCVIITRKRNNNTVDIGAELGRFMAAKDLLPQMLELRRRNLTYKQIAEELKVSPSIVGKMLKEVRESPELALEFIELTDFETGQTILSFTPEDFEKHRRTSTIYTVEHRLYEIREGLIHSTEFHETYGYAGAPSLPISNWYGNLIKLYGGGVNWNGTIIDKHSQYSSLMQPLSKINERQFTEKLKNHLDDLSNDIEIEDVDTLDLAHYLLKRFNQRHSGLQQRITHISGRQEYQFTPAELHWLNDKDLMEKANKLVIESAEYEDAMSTPQKIIDYCLPWDDGHGVGIATIDELIHDSSLGFKLMDGNALNQTIMGSHAWWIYKGQNLSIETWQKMWQLKIFDYDDYLRISPWVELDWNQTLQLIPGIENNSNSWARAIHQRKIDSVIESAENLGWTPELIGGAIELSEKFNIDLETVEQMGISNIQLAINSLKYCRKKGLEVNADNLPWFEKHNWKIPKLKKGFASYVGVDIFDQLSNVKSNYIHLNDLIVMFNNSDAPKLHLIFSMPNQRIQRIQTEINALRPRGHPNHHQALRIKNLENQITQIKNTEDENSITTNGEDSFFAREFQNELFNSICFSWKRYIGIRPCTPELFEMLAESQVPLEEIKNDDITNVLSAIENLNESNVEINAEIIEWASQKQWDISQLGQFKTYRQRWLYHRLIEYEIPAVRMDKLLDEYNNSTEPGTNLASELELHEVLQQSPFKELCTSSSDGGMVFFDKDASNSKVNSIIEEKIVVKNVVFEKKVYVEKDTISVQPLVDLEPYPLILKSDSDYAKRAVETIRKADLIGSINDVWRLLSIEAKTLFEDEIDRESNFNVILVDKLCEKLSIDERQQKKIHQLRRARNDFDKGKSESPIKPNNSLVINGLETIEKIMSL